MKGSHQSSKDGEVDPDRQRERLDVDEAVDRSNRSTRSPSRAPASPDSLRAPGCTSATPAQNGESGPRPPAWSQTDAATATGPGHPRHLPEAGGRVAHEVHDELRQCEVEGAVLEGQLLGAARAHVDLGQPFAQAGDERHRGVERHHVRRPEPVDQHGGERAGAAAHVEGAVARLRPEQVEERHRERQE